MAAATIAFIAPIVGSLLLSALRPDFLETTVVGDDVIYTFKITSLAQTLVELKSKIISIINIPPDIPKNIEIQLVKSGKVFKEFLVTLTVDKNKIGKLRDLLSKKYGIIREWPYSSV